MLAVGPLGPQYSLLFAWHELGKNAACGGDTLPRNENLMFDILKYLMINVLVCKFLDQNQHLVNSAFIVPKCVAQYMEMSSPDIHLLTMNILPLIRFVNTST